MHISPDVLELLLTTGFKIRIENQPVGLVNIILTKVEYKNGIEATFERIQTLSLDSLRNNPDRINDVLMWMINGGTDKIDNTNV